MQYKIHKDQKVYLKDIPKDKYVYRHKHIGFNGGGGPETPQRKDNLLDNFDTVFDTKEEYTNWYRSAVIGLAELDESMNYCAYFVRDKGNVGTYEREGKSFPVDGSWVGIQDFDNYKPAMAFVEWLETNGWRNNWFKLMPRYTEQQANLLPTDIEERTANFDPALCQHGNTTLCVGRTVECTGCMSFYQV